MTVKKFGGGASLVLISHIIECSQLPRGGKILTRGGKILTRGGKCPLNEALQLSCIIQTASSCTTQSTHIVSCPPQWLCACLDATGRLPWGGGVPELDGGVVATRGQLPLIRVTPVQVVNPRHVCSDVA